jgi:hypothetical protein
MNFGNSHMRIHQHRTAQMQGEQERDVPACIGQAQEREGQTGKGSVDVRKLSTHLPLVQIKIVELIGKYEIETQEEIPGGPYKGEGLTDGRYTLAADGNEFITANMKIYDGEGDHTLYDSPEVKTQIRIRIRGNTSRKRQEYPFPAMRASNFSTMPASKSRVALSMGNIPAASPAPITFSPVSRQWI